MEMDRDKHPPGIRFGIVRGISYGLFGPPDQFVPQVRELGAGLVRVYFNWGQVEPEPDRWAWDAVDAFLAQLDGSEEVWVTVCSSSPWATRQPTTFLPSSPANDPAAYERFVRRLVERFAGRAQYWQCDNEPSNVGLLWAGTAEEYVAQLRVLHRAVGDVDPGAAVVLGGAPYGLPNSAPDSDERRFFDVLLRDGRDWFDLFDLHLYADAARIPADIETVRSLMRRHGYEKPVVVGEYNAPSPDLYPEAADALREAMAAAFAVLAGADGGATPPDPPEPPDRAAMAALYGRMADLPPQLQMFMAGCPRELEDRRDRINRREIVMRNLLALSAGISRTVCWNLAPEIPNYEDRLSVMDLFYGKFPLMAYEGTELRRRRPPADAFALMTERLAGVEAVTRIDVPGRPGVFLFDVRRRDRGPLLVAWEGRDSFAGEDEPPAPFAWPWPSDRAAAVDALGRVLPAEVAGGMVGLPLSPNPVFIAHD